MHQPQAAGKADKTLHTQCYM